MKIKKKLLFLTGTRADFGKLKPLIYACNNSSIFETTTFVTGMHMLKKYGSTWEEVESSNIGNLFKFINQNEFDFLDSILTKTISGLSDYIREENPDLVIVHGDRPEALAGAISGTLNNTRVAHVEGGEISGTLDELVRHSISKMSHSHFVSNVLASNRLIQMGETADRIFQIGSPEVDIMTGSDLPSLLKVKERYEISFEEFHIVIFHPLVFELDSLCEQITELVRVISLSQDNFIVIYPNNDQGSNIILNEYLKLDSNPRVRLIPSMRFEYYLTLLKNATSIIGNSSSGVREAPVFGIPTINIGSRQFRRNDLQSIMNVHPNYNSIMEAIKLVKNNKFLKHNSFGHGNSAHEFCKILSNDEFWAIPVQKQFKDVMRNENKIEI